MASLRSFGDKKSIRQMEDYRDKLDDIRRALGMTEDGRIAESKSFLFRDCDH